MLTLRMKFPSLCRRKILFKNNAEFHRNGWYHNGTSYSDIGELRLYNNGASISHTIADNYMSSDGVSVSGSEMLARAQAGALKVAVSPTVGTQSHPNYA